MANTSKIEFACSDAFKKKVKAAAKKAKAESVSDWIRKTLSAAMKKK